MTGRSPPASGGAGSCQQFGEILIAEQGLKVGQRPRHALAPHKQQGSGTALACLVDCCAPAYNTYNMGALAPWGPPGMAEWGKEWERPSATYKAVPLHFCNVSGF